MKTTIAAIIFIACSLVSHSQKLQKQIDDYIAFYYPATGSFVYELTADWGHLLINTGDATDDEEVHTDSKPFVGFISVRSVVTGTYPEERIYTYLITPEGEVWRTLASDIPLETTREEVTKEKFDGGVSTLTTTISSSLEPVVIHFKENKDQWSRYGTLVEKKKGKYKLEKSEG